MRSTGALGPSSSTGCHGCSSVADVPHVSSMRSTPLDEGLGHASLVGSFGGCAQRSDDPHPAGAPAGLERGPPGSAAAAGRRDDGVPSPTGRSAPARPGLAPGRWCRPRGAVEVGEEKPSRGRGEGAPGPVASARGASMVGSRSRASRSSGPARGSCASRSFDSGTRAKWMGMTRGIRHQHRQRDGDVGDRVGGLDEAGHHPPPALGCRLDRQRVGVGVLAPMKIPSTSWSGMRGAIDAWPQGAYRVAARSGRS